MHTLPITTILIAAGLLVLSVAIVSRFGSKIRLSGPVLACFLLVGLGLFIAGLYLHLKEAPAETKRIVQPKPSPPAVDAFTFSFTPSKVAWGQVVDIETSVPADSVTVYLNGLPLIKRNLSGHKLQVTIPTNTKDGYLELEQNGKRVKATQPLAITP
jgi:hypothetical protein